MTDSKLTPADRLLFALFSSSAALLGRLDVSGIRRLSSALSVLLWHGLPSRRRLAIRNISERLGMTESAAAEMARKSFSHNMQSFLECVLIPRFQPVAPHFIIDNPDLVHRVITMGRPVVGSTAHLGAWELLAAVYHTLCPPDGLCTVVVRRYRSAPFNSLMVQLRGSRGIQVIGHRNAAKEVLRTLRHQGAAAFLVDHHAGSDEALALPFLGKEAAVNMGPAVLAVRAQALIWPIAILREGDNYRLHTQEPLDTRDLTGEPEARIRAAAQFYTEAVERMIKLAPEQWFWLHNRWK